MEVPLHPSSMLHLVGLGSREVPTFPMEVPLHPSSMLHLVGLGSREVPTCSITPYVLLEVTTVRVQVLKVPILKQ